MTDNAVEALAQLVELAYEPIEIDWADVELTLRQELPSDYKEFATRFGPGHFRDGYLWVAIPVGSGPRLNFFDSLGMNLEILRDVRMNGVKLPYPLYPEKSGLLPWGSTVDGDVFFWITAHDDPDKWTVVVNEVRTENWVELDGSMTQALVALLTGHVQIGFLEEGLGDGPHRFVRMESRIER